jgi:hypothetical protein
VVTVAVAIVLEEDAFVEASLVDVRRDTGLLAVRRAIAGAMRIVERRSVLMLDLTAIS